MYSVGQGGVSDRRYPGPVLWGLQVGQSLISAHCYPVAAAEATQETVESLMQKFKESFRTNMPIEIGQLQPAPRTSSAGKRKRRSKSRGRPSWCSGQKDSKLSQGSTDDAGKSVFFTPVVL